MKNLTYDEAYEIGQRFGLSSAKVQDVVAAAQSIHLEIEVQTKAANHWMSEANKSHNLTVKQQAEIDRLTAELGDAAFVKACRDELAKRKPEPAAETVGGLAKAVKAARGGDAPPAPMRRFA